MPFIYNYPEYINRRKRLRNNASKPEVILWSYLQGRNFYGYKFRRQHGIGHYIVDFYCPRLNLVVELDGGQHFEPQAIAYDKKRDAFIRSLGIEIVRFPNNELLNNKYGVLDKLLEAVKSREKLLNHPDQR